jgi:protein-tyrosine phosphatase
VTATTHLSNLRQIGGAGFQNGRRRTVYRANTESVDSSAYPTGLAAILDLRRGDEIARVPHALAESVGYQNLPLFDPSSELESSAGAVQIEEQYIDWLERHRETIALVFRRLAEIDGDALVCCSAGKDRTGVVSGLLARLWGADLDRVGVDYALTRDALAERFAAERNITDDLDWTLIQQRCVPEIMTTVVEHVEFRYGSVAGYLSSIGLTDAEIAAL